MPDRHEEQMKKLAADVQQIKDRAEQLKREMAKTRMEAKKRLSEADIPLPDEPSAK